VVSLLNVGLACFIAVFCVDKFLLTDLTGSQGG
jgi:hypothetical protein